MVDYDDFYATSTDYTADKLIQKIRDDTRLWEILKLADKAREIVRLISKQVFNIYSQWVARVPLKAKVLFHISGHLPWRIRRLRK